MKTLRRVAIVSAICLLISLLATAVLVPSAIADTQRLGQELDTTYGQITQVLTIPGEGVKTVSIYGDPMSSLHLKVSPDDQIHIYIDGYRLSDPSFPYVLSQDGHLQISYNSGPQYFLSIFTRENLLRSLAAGVNGKGLNDVELELPKGIAFDLSQRQSWGAEIDLGVETYRSIPQPPANESSSGADEEKDLRRIGDSIRDQNNRIRTLYQRYEHQSIDQTQAVEELESALRTTAQLLAQVPVNGESSEDMEESFYDLGQLQMEKNFIELHQEDNEKRFRAGEITKEEFYQTDLALDDAKEDVELRLEEQGWVHGRLKKIEKRLNVDSLLDEEADD